MDFNWGFIIYNLEKLLCACIRNAVTMFEYENQVELHVRIQIVTNCTVDAFYKISTWNGEGGRIVVE